MRGVVHAVALAPSSEHVNVALGLVLVNVNVADVVFTKAAGLAVMVGVGVMLGGAARAVPPVPSTNARVMTADAPRRVRFMMSSDPQAHRSIRRSALPSGGVGTSGGTDHPPEG